MGVDFSVDKALEGFLEFQMFVGELHGGLRLEKL
jgi:hypothetical protein